MTILGIETTCDETSASIVEDGTRVLSLVTATSQDMHVKYGGIIPDKAARAQLESILPVIKESSQNTDIDAIAVSYGPGLIGSLLIGVETAKTLALAWNKPLIPVNHLVGHIYANWLENEKLPQFPALVLLVSGGHSELILMKNHNDFELLGSTRDDAAGECFDKCGRLLGLPYPYGIYIQDEAAKYNPKNHQPFLPRPMLDQKNYDFSFSGLKTAVSNSLTRHPSSELAFELQEAITDVLVQKTLKASEKLRPKSILLAGGVAANKRLRGKIQGTNVFIPPSRFCTDNAAVIASSAYFNKKSVPLEKIIADPGLTVSSVE